ncbi:MAG TPA: RHS repeat-associated core domain-containing protein, partial [Chitinispirillaceae bacterium]|nr:RHS repeat-associated core domain-containing protein [Chitinispirillaceae bacterium]
SSSTDPFGNQTIYTYNGRGLQTEIIDGKGNTTTIFRNSLTGEVEFQSNPLGEKTIYSHDEFGRQVQIVGPRNDTTRFVFDKKGRATRVIDALHNITAMVYDCDDNVIMDTLPDGSVNHYEFTANGKLRKTINPSGDSVITEYNAEDQPVKRINEKGLSYHFSYDSTGRIMGVKDPSGKLTVCTYDSANNINSITDPSGHISTLIYDESKQLIKRENRLGNQTTISRSKDLVRMYHHTKTSSDSTEGSEYFLFDKGRISMSFIAHGNSSGRNINYYYDLTGNIDSTVIYNISDVRSPAPGVSILPERLGRSTYKKYDRLNRMISNTDRFGNTVLYSYDKAGNIDTITYSDGKKVTYTYDLLNQMNSVTDWNNLKTTYTYDKTGNVVQINLPDSSTIIRTYDRSSRLVSHMDIRGKDTLLTYNYQLDPVGNRISQSTKVPARPVVNDSTIDYTYNALNQLMEINGKNFSYDNAGNLASGFIAGKQVSLFYTGNNQLQKIGNDFYDYDYGEREYRTFTSLNNVPTIYVNNVSEDFYQVLEEQDTSSQIKTRYVYGLGLISCQKDSTISIYHFDPHGNTLALTNLNGTITDTYSYDPYGKLLSATGNSANPYRFGGRDGVRDDGNGLLFMRTRYYSPEMMRFIQMDRSSAGEISNPQTLNMYLYTVGNPINFTDPNGDWFGIDDAIEFVVGFAAGVIAQGISDIVTGETSSWETYLGSGLNGGITAWSSTYVGPVLGGMLGGAIGNATTQGLSLLAGDQQDWNWLSFGTDVGVGAIGGIFGKVGGKIGAKVAPKLFNKGAGTAAKYFTKECGTLKSWSKIIGKLIYQTGQKSVTKIGKNHFQTKVKPFVEENIGLAIILPLYALTPVFSLDD